MVRRIAILGGGLSGIVMTHLLQARDSIEEITIFEKEDTVGGLCRSFSWNDLAYDIGPHILFSKNQDVLNLMTTILENNIGQFRRNSKVYIHDRFTKYPIENDLAALSEQDRIYCLNRFIDNPYIDKIPTNLLQFFLRTFGEGITNLYLRPYNEKIWKYDPAFMDTQMVDRIPLPPLEDIVKGSQGIPTEGNLHQLNFYYPLKGGIMALIQAFLSKQTNKIKIKTNCPVAGIRRNKDGWQINTYTGFDTIISTIPLITLTSVLEDVPHTIQDEVLGLKHNSLVILVITLKKDNLKDYLSVMVPDPDIIFHRVTSLNFFQPHPNNTLLVEITYRKKSIGNFKYVLDRVLKDLRKINFIDSIQDYIAAEMRQIPNAYVIYDLGHQERLRIIKEYYRTQGIHLCGRFGEHRYLNMDGVIANCFKKVEEI